MLKIHLKDKSRDAIWIVEKNYSIGSGSGCNLQLNDASIDETHARLITENNKLLLKDNRSASGSYVNGQRITQKEVLPGDLIRLGKVEIDVLDPRETLSQPILTDEVLKTRWKLVADSSWLAGQEYLIPVTSATIGRASDCDIVIPGTHLSRQHAEFNIKDNALHIRDLGSANGTFINDERVIDGIALPGDRLRLDVYSFRVIGPPGNADRTQLRRPRHQNFTPLEQNALPSDPKNWKIKPTSPGNRIEPARSTGSKVVSVISIALLVMMISLLVYFFIF